MKFKPKIEAFMGGLFELVPAELLTPITDLFSFKLALRARFQWTILYKAISCVYGPPTVMQQAAREYTSQYPRPEVPGMDAKKMTLRPPPTATKKPQQGANIPQTTVAARAANTTTVGGKGAASTEATAKTTGGNASASGEGLVSTGGGEAATGTVGSEKVKVSIDPKDIEEYVTIDDLRTVFNGLN